MKKFFIKYRNIIMALVSVGLMLAFGIMGPKNPDADSQSKVLAGTLDGKKVTVGTIEGYKTELAMLREFRFLPSDGPSWIDQLAGEDGRPDLFYYLLNQEAARYTSVNLGPEEVVKMIVDSGMSESDLNNRLNTVYRISNRSTLAQIVSRYYTVMRYVNFLQSFAQPISAMELSADKELRRVQVKYVPIEGTAGWEKIPDVDVKDLLAGQFETYRNIVRTTVLRGPNDPPVFLGIERDDKGDYALLGYPGSIEPPAQVRENETIAWDGSKLEKIYTQGDIIGYNGTTFVRAPADALQISGGGRTVAHAILRGYNIHGNPLPPFPPETGGHHFPFGYKYPNRVKVEYIQFLRAPLRAHLQVTAADVEAALKVFQADPYKFRDKPVSTAPAASISIAAPGAIQTAPATASQPAERTPGEILTDWDDTKVKQPYLDAQLDLRTKAILKKLVDAARTKADAPWRRPAPPERTEWESYARLAEGISQDPTLGKYLPVVGTTGADFVDASQLLNIPGIGHGVYTSNQGSIFDFPTLATNILELVTPDKRQPLGLLGLQMGHEGPEVTDRDGNVYLFRVTEFEKTHAPASLDEVRAQVVEDAKKLKAYNDAKKAIQPAVDDLDALAKQYGSAVRQPKEFNRDESVAPVDVQGIRDFVKTAFTLPDPKEAKPPASTSALLENENTLKFYPMKVLQVLPASGPDFASQLSKGFFNRMDPATQQFWMKYLETRTLAERLKFSLPPGTSWPTPASRP